MNATPAITDDAWTNAINSVNAWRGQALQCFAQTEAAVSETLLTLAKVERSGGSVKLRRLIGQRFQDLHDAVAVDGPFAHEGAAVLAALTTFREHEALRTALCHGVAKVALDRQGQWVLVLKILSFRNRDAERSSVTLEQHEAEALLTDVRSRAQRLGSALGLLRSSMKALAAAAR